MSEKRFLLIVAAVAMFCISAPYLAAFYNSGDNLVFGGFLINPVDGHSYLAKMQIGLKGEWKFVLPYTSEPGNGAFLFLFYIGLGHLARLLSLPLIAVFHGTRLFSGLILIWSIWGLSTSIFKESRDRKLFFLICVFGSGLGWIAAVAGLFTSDFWVAEAFPFLSMYTNPHFTLGLALMILALIPKNIGKPLLNIILGLLIGIIQPFGVVIIIFVKLGLAVINSVKQDLKFREILVSEEVIGLIGFGLSGGSFLIYQFWTITNDPVLSLWHSQNITLKPSIADLVISLSPCLPLAVIGVKEAWSTKPGVAITVWAVISLALVFMPWSLQRRFLTGIYVPLSVLCVYGVKQMAEWKPNLRIIMVAILFLLAIPTNLLVILTGFQAAAVQDPKVYIDSSTLAALEWIDQYSDQDSLILAEEDIGLLVPSATGRKVIYGHPFETVSAEKEKELIESFYYRESSDEFYQDNLEVRGIDYVMLTERSTSGMEDWLDENWYKVFNSGSMTIYSNHRQ